MMARILETLSNNARICLIIGLAAGVLWPDLAKALAYWLPELVALLLTITAFRIGHSAVTTVATDLKWGVGAIAVLQLAVPLIIFCILTLLGVAHTPAALAMVLVTSAPALSGSTNLALLLGLDAGKMMQIMVMGTAAFPITVFPILYLLPQIGSISDVLQSSVLVLSVILFATLVGFGLRAALFPHPTQKQINVFDGASVLAFSVLAVALMAPLNGAIRADPKQVILWAVLAFGISYGLQIITLMVLRRSALRSVAGPLAIGAGNRNIALFLVALPSETLAPLLVFIGCWQLPMYLTPILLPSLYRKALHDG